MGAAVCQEKSSEVTGVVTLATVTKRKKKQRKTRFSGAAETGKT